MNDQPGGDVERDADGHPAPLLGLDLGGSGFRLRGVRLVEGAPWPTLEVAPPEAVVEERWSPGFEPVPLERQLAERESPRCTPAEERESRARIRALAAAVERLSGGRPARLAVAAPGLRTRDGRGVVATRFGPRAPRLLEQLVEACPGGVRVARELVGDGLAGARGEQVAPAGALRGLARGYYLGGGSGVAEALVLEGEAHELPHLGLPRAFELELPDVPGTSYQDVLSPAPLLEEPERLAEPAERERFALRLEELVRRRGDALRDLRPDRSPPLRRVVLAQAYAFLPRDFLAPALERLRSTGVRVSSLRAAPSLGAVALALERTAREGAGAWNPR